MKRKCRWKNKRAKCRSCRKIRMMKARELCDSCYMNPTIRKKFPSISKFNGRKGEIEPTLKELDKMIREQKKNLPKWWKKDCLTEMNYEHPEGDKQPVKLMRTRRQRVNRSSRSS